MDVLGPGAHLTTSIRLSRQLGEGGMGSVWVADHLTLNTQVVVKFMSEGLAENPDALARFKREAASASAVKSPHVVQIFDYGVAANGSPYIVMEMLEGEDLRHRLDRVGALPPHEVCAIISQAAKALGRAHARGVVHRDIKPDNIFLCDAGNGEVFVKVLDFGIAKTGDSEGFGATKTGAMLGTPYYMSPEQVLGAKTIDHRTDIWSLGIVTYEAITGHKAFEADTIGALSIAIVHGPMPKPSAVRSSLPPTFDVWFSRACARDVSARYASTKDLADELTLALGDFEATATMEAPRLAPTFGPGGTVMMSTTASGSFAQPAAGRPIGLPGRSRARWPIAVAAVAVGALIGAIVYLVSGNSSSKRADPTSVEQDPTQPKPAKKAKPPPTEEATKAPPDPIPSASVAPPITTPPVKPKTTATTSVTPSIGTAITAPPPAKPKPSPPNDPTIF